jgi:hypothetical protein
VSREGVRFGLREAVVVRGRDRDLEAVLYCDLETVLY